MNAVTPSEVMICAVANLLDGSRHIAVGAASPIPAAGAMLRRAIDEARGGESVRISILGSVDHNVFTNGSTELFDCAAQGRIDAFFLSGGQIDGQGNINLVGIGEYPETKVRWPGSFGSAYLYFLVPKVILFREEHTPRIFVDKVDFISAPGTSDKNTYRKGGPIALLTGKALFRFDKDKGSFDLQSIHPGHNLDEVAQATGFTFGHDDSPPTTSDPDPEILNLLRARVLEDLSETYPDFANKLRAEIAALSERTN
ncbi:MAG: CoA synthetase [Rhodobacteraceae bacterium]|nr:CoA synthetase [Paracoccaceae bacterium]